MRTGKNMEATLRAGHFREMLSSPLTWPLFEKTKSIAHNVDYAFSMRPTACSGHSIDTDLCDSKWVTRGVQSRDSKA